MVVAAIICGITTTGLAEPISHPLPDGGVVIVSHEPSWLVSPGTSGDLCGEIVRFGTSAETRDGFVGEATVGGHTGFQVRFCPDGKIAWANGSGIATHVASGERVQIQRVSKSKREQASETRWWKCASAEGCKADRVLVSLDTVIANRKDSSWFPPDRDGWTEVSCLYVSVSFQGLHYGGFCTPKE